MTAPNNAAHGAPEPGTAAPDTQPTHTGGPATDQDADPQAQTQAALNAENAKWRRQAREAQAELEKVKLATASEAERAIAAARAEGAAQYQAKWRAALVQNAALAVLAERGVIATEPALRSLDLDDVEVDDDGRFDKAAITARVDDLLSRYPMFAGRQVAPGIPTLSGDGQRRLGPDTQVRQQGKLSDAEAERMLRYGMGG